MQTVSKALSTWSPGSLRDTEPADLAVVTTVFNALQGQLGSKVSVLWANVPVATVHEEWALGLAGYDQSEIDRGLAVCRTRLHAPVLGEFLRMCRPALDPELAWLEAQAGMADRARGLRGDWTHPAVYRAARGFEYELRGGAYVAHRKQWEWRLEREFARGWGDVPAPQEQLTWHG